MSNEDRIARILADLREAKDRGEQVDVESILRRNSDIADALRARFRAAAVLREGAGAKREESPEVPREIGDYQIVREIGRGGMGVVYEAVQGRMRRRVALKLLSVAISGAPQAVKRFQREAQAAGRLHHTNIVPVFDLDQHGGQWFYAMELVDGRSLSDVIAELREHGSAVEPPPGAGSETASGLSGRSTADRAYYLRAAELFAGVADALELAHQEGIIHRDIKPSNLLLDADGILKVVDFGLARFDDGALAMTMTGDILGTPRYMSPEQAMAKRMGIDHRTDVYSLGATLYEVLTLRLPFDAENLQQLCSQIVTKDPRLPRQVNSRVPRDLETVVLKAMEKDPDRRYQSARALARDLRAVAEGGAIQARRVGVAGRAWRKVRRHRIRSALAAAALVLAALGALFAIRAGREADRRTTLEYERLCAQAHALLPRSMAAGSGRLHEQPTIPSPDRSAGGDSPLRPLDRAIELAPDRPDAWFFRALAAGRTVDERLGDIAAAEERGLDSRSADYARAWLLREAGRTKEAARAEAAAQGAPPAGARGRYFEALLRQSNGEWAEAADLLGNVLDDGATEPSLRYLARCARARSRRILGDLEGALADLHAARDAGDDSPHLMLACAAIWRRLGLAERAEEILETALRGARVAGTEAAWHELCDAVVDEPALARWGDRATAEAVRALPGSVSVLLSRREHLRNLGGREAEALELAERAYRLSPDSFRTRRAWGSALANAGRVKEARKIFVALAQERPSSRKVQWCLAWTAIALGRPAEALTSLEAILERDPLDADAHRLRASAMEKLGRSDEEVLAAVEKTLVLAPTDAWSLATRTQLLWKAGRRAEAVDAAKEAAELLPDDRSSFFRLGGLLARLGLHAQALEAYDRAIAAGEDSAAIHSNRATALQRSGRPNEAWEAWGEALRRDPDHANAVYGRASIQSGRRRYREALPLVEKALELDPGSANAHSLRGLVLVRLGRDEDAMKSHDRALALDPNSPVVHLNRGAALMETGRTADARAEFERAIELDPDYPEAHYDLSLLLGTHGRREEALTPARRARNLDPGNLRYVARVACLLNDLGRREEALRETAEVTDDGSREYAEIARVRGFAFEYLGRLEEALVAYDRAIELDRSFPGSWFGRGSVLAKQQRYEDAIEAFDHARTLGPGDAVSWHNRGFALGKLGRYEEAAEACEKALELRPDHPPDLSARGEALRAAGRLEEALPDFERLCELLPDDGQVHADLGNTLVLLGRHAEALPALERAIALGVDDEATLGNRAACLAFLGRREDAVAAFTGILDRGSSVQAHYNRGILLSELGRSGAALADFDRVIELEPDHPTARRDRASTLAALGRLEEAAREFEAIGADLNASAMYLQLRRPADALAAAGRAIAADKGNAMAHCNRASALMMLGRAEEALAACDEALRLDPELPQAHLGRGQLLVDAGRLEEGVKELERAVELGMAHPSVVNRLAWVLATAGPPVGDPEKAAKLARRAVAAAPGASGFRETLGVALYRAERLGEAATELAKAMELSGGGYPVDWLFLAMAKHRLGQEDARTGYDRTLAWMAEQESVHPFLEGLRAEAAEVLAIGED